MFDSDLYIIKLIIICLWSIDMDERDECEDLAASTNSKI